MKHSKVGYIFVAYAKIEGYWHSTDIAETKQDAIRQWEYDVCSEDWFEGYFIEVDITPPKMADEHSVNLNNYMVVKAH